MLLKVLKVLLKKPVKAAKEGAVEVY